MARVRDSSHFLAVSVDETNHAASARELNIAVQLEPANGARWHDAVQNRCVTVPIQQAPAADRQRVVAVISDRDMFDAALLVVGMHECCHDASRRSPIVIERCRFPVVMIRIGNRIPALVGVPGLGLEREEDGRPATVARVAKDETAVRPDPIVVPMLVTIALVHVHVVDAVARSEAEHEVGSVRLRPQRVP